MNSSLLEKYEYCLKWKDVEVLRFNVSKQSIKVINKDFLPLGISNLPESFDMISKFCFDRTLMLNREYCKEIITSCGLGDQSPITMCLISKALSFRDNYWIDRVSSTLQWRDVNLYSNEFSREIAKVSLTGEYKYIHIGDNIFTGELTNKGTRAKCFIRSDNGIYLLKCESSREISVEVASYYIADAMGILSSAYFTKELFGHECSVCKICTNERLELIPYRDIISAYDGKAYQFVASIDTYNFMLMQLFDYVTLNIDRNRDNFGLLRKDGELISLYPLFDHDSCFKGKGTNGVYFPTGKTFNQTLSYLKSTPLYHIVDINAIKNNLNSCNLKEVLLKYISAEDYDAMIKRVDHL